MITFWQRVPLQTAISGSCVGGAMAYGAWIGGFDGSSNADIAIRILEGITLSLIGGAIFSWVEVWDAKRKAKATQPKPD